MTNSIISIFKSVKDPNTPFNKNVFYALDRIKTGKSKTLVEQLREMSDDDYQKNKIKLPGVCFNGKFQNRSINGLLQHSGLIILDFDKFENKQDTIDFKNSICDDNFVFSAWISPSAKGVKVLVKVPALKDNHKGYFKTLEKHFESKYWDESGSDVSRFCFESYDPDIYINENSDIWIELDEPEIEDIGVFEPIVKLTSSNQIIQNLLTWWQKKYGANKGSRNNNLFKLACAFNDFEVDKTDALHECKKFINTDFTEKEIESIVKSAYKKQSACKSFEDVLKKEKIEKLIRSGKNKKDIEKEFKEVDISKIRENIDIDEFWYYNDKGKIQLSIHKFKFWLEQNNFFKYYPSKNSNTFTFIKKEQNLLEETNEKRIKDYVLNNILERSNIGYGPYDFMASNTSYFKSDFLSMLSTTDVKIKEDNKDECFLYYKNCVIKITKDTFEKIEYLDVDGYIWKRQIIDRDFEQIDHHKAEFRKFLWLISGKDVQKYNSFKTVIGYLMHSFKTSADNKAVIFNDCTVSENPNGGSGKGLFWNALKHMKKVDRIDGKSFEFTKSFPYQTVSTDTQVLVFDDVKKNFNFESLFSLITEGITLEYKGQDAITIPVEKSPKILITTNYTLGGVGGSHERRKFEVEMSDYFSYKHTPLDEFGHMLFSDWDSNQWLMFDNFMINCIQYYLEKGLLSHNFNNLEVRKFIKETSFEFYEWSQDDENLPKGQRLDKSEYFVKFTNDYPDFKKWLTQKKFTLWLENFGKFYKIETEQGRSHSVRWIYYKTNKQTIFEDESPF
jgi:hypothetical protein